MSPFRRQLPQQALATALCTPFEFRQLLPADTQALVRLVDAHGSDWLLALLRIWAAAATALGRSWGWSPHGSGLPGGDASAKPTGQWPEPLPDFIDAGGAARDLVPLLQALSSPDVVATPEWQALRGRVHTALLSALQPALQPALQWAESPSPQPLQLSLAEARRSHVQWALQDAAAPLTFATVKQGSPHKLVLSKRPGPHADWQRLREVWTADLAALGDVAKARGMAQIADAAGIGRESLYKALRPGAQPRFETIQRVCTALGVRLVAQQR